MKIKLLIIALLSFLFAMGSLASARTVLYCDNGPQYLDSLMIIANSPNIGKYIVAYDFDGSRVLCARPMLKNHMIKIAKYNIDGQPTRFYRVFEDNLSTPDNGSIIPNEWTQ